MTANTQHSTHPPQRLVSTGISVGDGPDPKHAAEAVSRALKRSRDSGGPQRVASVLLFLTPDYAFSPQAALTAAARAADCTHIVGCTGNGILTEELAISDGSGAAAMVFGFDHPLSLTLNQHDDDIKLTFSTPDAVSSDWLDAPTPRVGAIAADFFGHGPFAVWRSARVVEDGFVDVAASNVRVAAAASQGVRALTAPVSVGKVDGYDVLQIGRYPALNVLLQSLPIQPDAADSDKSPLPLGTLMCGVTFGDPQTAIKQGRYRLNHVVSADRNNQSITLSHPLNAGEHMFWAIRDKLASERAMQATLQRLEQRIGAPPDYAMLFPCLSRGSSFYGGRDRDIEIIQQRYPGLPMIGFYGNGQIAPLGLGAHLYQFSAAVALFSGRTPQPQSETVH